jgi:hypothetical protein
MEEFRLGGTITRGTPRAIADALAGLLDFSVRVKGDAVLVKGNTFSLSVYDSELETADGAQFLVSGSLRGPEGGAREVVSRLASAFKAGGLPYELELQDDNGGIVMHDLWRCE